MAAILEMVMKHWKMALVGLFIVAAVVDHYRLEADIAYKEAKIQHLEKANADCLAKNNSLNLAIQNQNALIKYWAGVDHQANIQLKKLENTIKQKQQQTDAIIKSIEKEPKLKTCQDAMHYLFDAATGELK